LAGLEAWDKYLKILRVKELTHSVIGLLIDFMVRL
jgi:hypothetical protein